MTAHNWDSPRTALGALLVGGLTGAAIALLFAPADGRTTRRQLARKARDTRQRAARLVEESRNAMSRQRRRLAEAATEGGKHLSQAGTHVAEAAREGRAALRDVVQEVTARSGRAGH